MRISGLLTDDAVLAEVGARLAATRLARNLTQQALATEAGVSKTTVERAETGLSVTLPNFLRILRALDLMDGLEQLLAPPLASPVDLVRREGRRRQRASGRRSQPSPDRRGSGGPRPARFNWGDESPQDEA